MNGAFLAFSINDRAKSWHACPSKLLAHGRDEKCASKGGFEYDRFVVAKAGDIKLSWNNWADHEAWLSQCVNFEGFELRKRHSTEGQHYIRRITYVCGRSQTGGERRALEPRTARKRKVGSKKVAGGCPCSLMVKTYPNTPIVFGWFTPQHNHPCGQETSSTCACPMLANGTFVGCSQTE